MHFEYCFDDWYVIMVMILMILGYGDDFGIWWWFDYMGVLYDNFMLWVVDLVIDGMMVHDYFMVNWMFGYYMFLD